LAREGIAAEKVHLVGNVMIDTLVQLLPIASRTQMPGLPARYALVTLHRPSNVDDPIVLQRILESLLAVSEDLTILFPLHPRTRQRIAELGFDVGQLRLLDPLPYIEFLALQRRAAVVITDSGGVQEETTYLQVPCLTLRENTERPITIANGTNVLVGNNMKKFREELAKILSDEGKKGSVPPLWDGRAGGRIAEILVKTAPCE
jgi:UDP-N-acetylglucosamine 2-epimerase (non-hydrolysing)